MRLEQETVDSRLEKGKSSRAQLAFSIFDDRFNSSIFPTRLSYEEGQNTLSSRHAQESASQRRRTKSSRFPLFSYHLSGFLLLGMAGKGGSLIVKGGEM